MIEKIVRDYLEAKLGCPVRLEVEGDELEMVVLEKTASGKSNHINSATIAIQSYSDSLYNASALNETVKATIEGIVELPEIADIRLNSDYNFTDTTKKRYRYQAVYDLIFY